MCFVVFRIFLIRPSWGINSIVTLTILTVTLEKFPLLFAHNLTVFLLEFSILSVPPCGKKKKRGQIGNFLVLRYHTEANYVMDVGTLSQLFPLMYRACATSGHVLMFV